MIKPQINSEKLKMERTKLETQLELTLDLLNNPLCSRLYFKDIETIAKFDDMFYSRENISRTSSNAERLVQMANNLTEAQDMTIIGNKVMFTRRGLHGEFLVEYLLEGKHNLKNLEADCDKVICGKNYSKEVIQISLNNQGLSFENLTNSYEQGGPGIFDISVTNNLEVSVTNYLEYFSESERLSLIKNNGGSFNKLISYLDKNNLNSNKICLAIGEFLIETKDES